MLKPLLEQYAKANASSAMSNPIVSQEVTAMVRQMAAVDDSLSWAASSLSTNESDLVTGKSRLSVLNSSIAKNFTNLNGTAVNGSASAVSTVSSDQICQSSNAKKCR
jgi:putative cell wall-binding protein